MAIVLRKPHITEVARVDGSKEKMVGLDGHINASSRQDLMKSLVEIARLVDTGGVATHQEVTLAQIEEVNASFKEAYNSPYRSQAWTEMGAAIAAEVLETAQRQGFMRNLFQRGNTVAGTDVRIKQQTRGMVAVKATGSGKVEPFFYEGKFHYPAEFSIGQRVSVLQTDIVRGGAELMEDALQEARESILVGEDRTWKALADAAVATGFNQLQTFVGGMTLNSAMVSQHLVQDYGIPTTTMLMASDGIVDLGATTFTQAMGPISQHELIMTGRLGNVLGMEVLTDAYRLPSLRVLSQGEIYFVGKQEYHGVYTDRDGLTATELNESAEGIPARGWHVYEIVSAVLPNVASVAKGLRA